MKLVHKNYQVPQIMGNKFQVTKSSSKIILRSINLFCCKNLTYKVKGVKDSETLGEINFHEKTGS